MIERGVTWSDMRYMQSLPPATPPPPRYNAAYGKPPCQNGNRATASRMKPETGHVSARQGQTTDEEEATG
ncbi:hypothetical protein DDE01_16000 [Desulfovibrio desulfuricans]|nr:hypothetical protein DDE01_16000 [Desulfovibrio desulfuricans]